MNGAGLCTREHTKYNTTMSSAGTWRDSNIHYEFTMDNTLWTGEWWLIHETRKILWQTITPEFGLAAVANIGDLRLKLWHSELEAEHGLLSGDRQWVTVTASDGETEESGVSVEVLNVLRTNYLYFWSCFYMSIQKLWNLWHYEKA